MGQGGSWIEERRILRILADKRLSPQHSLTEELKLLDVAALNGRLLATVPHDHIFAFLGHPSIKGLIAPDYACSMDTLNRRAAESILKRNCFESINQLC